MHKLTIGRETGRMTLTGLALTAAASLFVLSGCAGTSETGPEPVPAETNPNTPQETPEVVGPPPAEDAGTVTVTLEVTTNAEATVSWGDLGSSSTKDLAPGEPWQYIADGVDPWEDYYSVTVSEATYLNPDAVVGCTLYVDGVVVDQQEATGAGAMATCTQPFPEDLEL